MRSVSNYKTQCKFANEVKYREEFGKIGRVLIFSNQISGVKKTQTVQVNVVEMWQIRLFFESWGMGS